MPKGQIIKSTGGLYTVETADGLTQCKARGVFRNRGIVPYVGDFVEIEPTPEGTGTITEIFPRINSLIRPPVANLDYMVMVISTTDPRPNYVTIDKFLATMESHEVKTLIAVSKPDLKDPSSLRDLYRKAGYYVFVVNNETGEGTKDLESFLGKSLCAFAGNSGAGKSSLLNALDPSLNIEVGVTSKKLGRGKHTTRHVEIFTLPKGLRVADTPGFSSMDLLQTGDDISADNLDICFIDFLPYKASCKFNDCKHMAEIGCGIKQAVENRDINPLRYESYLQIYNEIKDVKQWERK